jgi:hypothetical protein
MGLACLRTLGGQRGFRWGDVRSNWTRCASETVYTALVRSSTKRGLQTCSSTAIIALPVVTATSGVASPLKSSTAIPG